ncbi:hypothetical protein, partial [Rhodopseudomonas sp. WA056]|uniref:hypothetical protein n=1 Tax=Rhodopseudomonas sp. WA056 TaxID=2269367 RepID=UPI00196883BC
MVTEPVPCPPGTRRRGSNCLNRGRKRKTILRPVRRPSRTIRSGFPRQGGAPPAPLLAADASPRSIAAAGPRPLQVHDVTDHLGDRLVLPH